MDLAVDTQFTDASGDQLRVLRTEIEDENFIHTLMRWLRTTFLVFLASIAFVVFAGSLTTHSSVRWSSYQKYINASTQ
ncbi:protein of unknown function [Candidatus Methylomirabilis oxygeniifera]|uniref:Uncharacterized protein n=1 Tax=Methylomirabilis oxygeniifera TaxID=671143 RepID=D5ML80_METO1|nr:protein of unknown function [Candidatus Methylomirabilis oxyfera]